MEDQERRRQARHTAAKRRQAVRRRKLVLVVAIIMALTAVFALVTRGNDQQSAGGSAAGGAGGSAAGGAGGSAAGGKSDQRPDSPDENGDVEAVRFTVAATGDFLVHSPVYARALSNGGGKRYDFKPMFRYIRPYINGADLAICHFETPMAGGPPAGYPMFNTPQSLAKDAKTVGWDVCDTASNHTLDHGQSGINATIRAIRRAGLKSTGSARSAAGQRKIHMFDVKGIRVAFLAYTDSMNGIPLPKRYSVNMLKASRALADARRAKQQGARVVIVNLHWGEEYQNAVSRRQSSIARRLTRSTNVDAIIGQHVHVVQPIRRRNGKLVVFGEGNLISNQSAACCAIGSQDGIIAMLHFVVRGDEVEVKRIHYIPVWVRRTDYAVLPVGDALKGGWANAASLRASYMRTVSTVGRLKRVRPEPRRLR